jgi:hypothetical protein
MFNAMLVRSVGGYLSRLGNDLIRIDLVLDPGSY